MNEVLGEVFLDHNVSEGLVKRACVRYKGRCHQHVSYNNFQLFVQSDDRVGPPLILTAQRSNQPFGQIKPPGASFCLVDGPLFVILCLLELCVQLGQLGIELSDDFLDMVQFYCGYFQLLFGFLELLSQWTHLLDDVVELDDV